MTTTHLQPTFETEGWRLALVYGLGVSGRAATQLLVDRGVAVIAHDERDEEVLDLKALREGAKPDLVEWIVGRVLGALPEGVDVVVLSPGVPGDRPLLEDARQKGIEIVAEVELAFRALDHGNTVVAITGSNGKSTTTALTGVLLQEAGYETEVCGNIGKPMSSCVAGPTGRIFVVELSSFQLETIRRLRPNAAALLNVAPDHLDRYQDFDHYRSAKERVFHAQRESDVAILNGDDARLLQPEKVRAKRRYFSTRGPVLDGCYLAGDRVLEVSDGQETLLFERGDLRLPGLHNVENAMAAALLARAVGCEEERLREGLHLFTGLSHRIEFVSEIGGVGYYDDSKGTNMAATIRSLEGFDPGTIHLILGGRNKDADPSELRESVQNRVKGLYLIGEAAADFEVALESAAPIRRSGTLEVAVVEAASAAVPGDVVLLSPACASFDQFDSYSHRGDVFKQLVRAMGTEALDG